MVDRVGLNFKYYLVFVEHGVGRARSVNDAPGEAQGRKPRPFLMSSVERYVDDLANLAARYSGDDMVDRTDAWLRNIDRDNTSVTIKKI
ncbi:MAG: hypothetical protein V2I33_18335 [Kangiellaceae bacterium]|nr:hypothetical protein [Kangiellaceae bacterium]